MSSNYPWMEVLDAHFGVRCTPDKEEAWTAVKMRVVCGQYITGKVVARAHFGLFIDVGVGFPACLLVPRIIDMTREWYESDTYYPVGSEIKVWVCAFDDHHRQFVVSQIGDPAEITPDPRGFIYP